MNQRVTVLNFVEWGIYSSLSLTLFKSDVWYNKHGGLFLLFWVNVNITYWSYLIILNFIIT